MCSMIWKICHPGLPSSKIFLLTVLRRYFFCWSCVLLMSCVCHAFASVHGYLVVICWERADLLALVCDVYCDLCHFPLWYPGSDVVLDCIDFWSLPSFLLGRIRINNSSWWTRWLCVLSQAFVAAILYNGNTMYYSLYHLYQLQQELSHDVQGLH